MPIIIQLYALPQKFCILKQKSDATVQQRKNDSCFSSLPCFSLARRLLYFLLLSIPSQLKLLFRHVAKHRAMSQQPTSQQPTKVWISTVYTYPPIIDTETLGLSLFFTNVNKLAKDHMESYHQDSKSSSLTGVDMWEFPEYSDKIPYVGHCCVNGQFSVHTSVQQLTSFGVNEVPKGHIQQFLEAEMELTVPRKLSVKRLREVLTSLIDPKTREASTTAHLQDLLNQVETKTTKERILRAEYAPKSKKKSKCRLSKENIQEGELRIGYGDFRAYLGKMVYDWYKIDAFFDTSLTHKIPSSTHEIDNFDQLTQEDQHRITEKLEMFGGDGGVVKKEQVLSSAVLDVGNSSKFSSEESCGDKRKR